jgi:branched-chain amino acid transport system permease protein
MLKFAAHSPLDHRLGGLKALVLFLVLVVLPAFTTAVGGDFYLGLAARILIFALAASSLNLILGFGGLVSFGHAAFVGVGAYTAALLQLAGVGSALGVWLVAMAVAAVAAALVGAICLRTRGVYFIMITLAFAQMLYYLTQATKAYGGDDGLALPARLPLLPGVDLSSDRAYYWAALGCTALGLVLMARLLNARFGHALQALRDNEVRMEAMGLPVLRYQLMAFVIAGAWAGLAGALLAGLGNFVSPAMMQWSQSGLLMVMVILGGVGRLWGGALGAVVFLLLEEVLSHYTIYWQFALGAVLLLVVLSAPQGLLSLWGRWRKVPTEESTS